MYKLIDSIIYTVQHYTAIEPHQNSVTTQL